MRGSSEKVERGEEKGEMSKVERDSEEGRARLDLMSRRE